MPSWRVPIFLSMLLTCRAFAGPANVNQLSQTAWTVGNDFVERRIEFSPENGLQTESLRYKVSGHDFMSYGRDRSGRAGEFSFRSNGQEFTGAKSFSLVRAESSSMAGGKLLRVDLTNPDAHLDVSVYYASYDRHPALRKWVMVTNRGSGAITLSNFCFETLSAAPGIDADLQVSSGYGAVPRELFFTGRASDPAIFIRNAKTGEGFAILNEAPGYLKRTEVGSGWSQRFMVMYDTDLFPFGRTLNAGETFESAKASLVFFSDNHGLSDSRWVLPQYTAQVIERRHGGEQPPWIFNTWEPFLRNIDQETVGQLAQSAKEMGLDIFTIDDGWQAEYGSNEFDTARFPDGYKGVKAALDSRHLRLGLWVPLAAISTKTNEYIAHPEWACRDQNGKAKSTQTASGTQAVMCLASGYREAALKRLTSLIERYHPAYLKIDLTTVFNAYGEQPGCYATDHPHHSWPESLTMIYEGLQYIGQQLFSSHPEVLIDYTFELWGEKHLIDPALLGSADLDWLSNVSDTAPSDGGPLNARMLLYSRAPSIPVETMLIGNLRASIAPIEERFATAIGAGPLFLGDLRQLSSQGRAWYFEKIGWFKDLRRRASLADSFFPLGNWRQPGAATWDGFARLSRDSAGIVVLFKNASAAESATVQLVAPPGVSYRAKSVVTGADAGTVSADELAQGWKVKFSSGHAVEILELERLR